MILYGTLWNKIDDITLDVRDFLLFAQNAKENVLSFIITVCVGIFQHIIFPVMSNGQD